MRNGKKRHCLAILLFAGCALLCFKQNVSAESIKNETNIIYTGNNTWESAVEFTEHQAVEGRISKEHLDQYYKFRVTNPVWYGMDLKSELGLYEAGNTPTLCLYNSRRKLLYRCGASSKENIGFDVYPAIHLYPGTYYIRVSGDADVSAPQKEDAYGSYQLFAGKVVCGERLILAKENAVYTGGVIPFPKVTIIDDEGELKKFLRLLRRM